MLKFLLSFVSFDVLSAVTCVSIMLCITIIPYMLFTFVFPTNIILGLQVQDLQEHSSIPKYYLLSMILAHQCYTSQSVNKIHIVMKYVVDICIKCYHKQKRKQTKHQKKIVINKEGSQKTKTQNKRQYK